MTLGFHQREQIESWVGRALTPRELETVETIERLTPEHLEVARQLCQHQLVACMLYLRAVVPSALTRDLQRFMVDVLGA
jgi:hypothetical protein